MYLNQPNHRRSLLAPPAPLTFVVMTDIFALKASFTRFPEERTVSERAEIR